MNVIIVTVSGVKALVAATSLAAAEKAWRDDVNAENMREARRPYRGEVRDIAADGEHDYR